jgi:hypothetical protein
MGQLILKRASASRPSGEWNDDVVIGRIFKANASPVGASWMWTLAFGHHEDRTPTHGYAWDSQDRDDRIREEFAAGIDGWPRLVAFVALASCFVAGYFVADLWSKRDTSPLAQICARVDYVNGLQENFKGTASEEAQAELKALAEPCRTAMRNRADEND